MIKHVLFVGLGGGIGSMLRYLTSLLVNRYIHHSFPFATFIVNMLGCFLIGLCMGWIGRYELFDRELKYLLMAGFCGGYTTFSTFSAENANLLESGEYIILGTYILTSIAVGLFAVYLGQILSKP